MGGTIRTNWHLADGHWNRGSTTLWTMACRNFLFYELWAMQQYMLWTIQYEGVYLTCSKKLRGRQLSLPHGVYKKLKYETKNKMMSEIGPVQIHRLLTWVWINAELLCPMNARALLNTTLDNNWPWFHGTALFPRTLQSVLGSNTHKNMHTYQRGC